MNGPFNPDWADLAPITIGAPFKSGNAIELLRCKS